MLFVSCYQLNASYSSLKRVLVGKSIVVQVREAKQVSIFQTFDRSFSVNGSVNNRNSGFCSIWDRLCMPILHISFLEVEHGGSFPFALFSDDFVYTSDQ